MEKCFSFKPLSFNLDMVDINNEVPTGNCKGWVEMLSAPRHGRQHTAPRSETPTPQATVDHWPLVFQFSRHYRALRFLSSTKWQWQEKQDTHGHIQSDFLHLFDKVSVGKLKDSRTDAQSLQMTTVYWWSWAVAKKIFSTIWASVSDVNHTKILTTTGNAPRLQKLTIPKFTVTHEVTGEQGKERSLIWAVKPELFQNPSSILFVCFSPWPGGGGGGCLSTFSNMYLKFMSSSNPPA